MAATTEPAPQPSANGDLVNRVQQLRLDNQLGMGGGGRAWGGALLPWVLCGLMAVTWAGVGVRAYKSAGTATETAGGVPAAGAAGGAPPTGGGAPPVEAGAPVTQLKGNVIPSLQVTVSPRDVAAEITEIFFTEGKRVKQGEKLATLLDLQYANRRDTDKAALASAEAQVERAKAGQVSATAKLAKVNAALVAAEARRVRALAIQDRAIKDFDQALMQRKAGGVISAQDFQRFEADKKAADADLASADADIKAAEQEVKAVAADLNTAAANLKAADADLKAAEARFKEAERLVANCVVAAPIDGTILTKSADKGALVSPMSFNVAAGICSIADLAKLEVEIDVPERQITRIQKGQRCKLQADADPTREYRGVVDRVMPIADDTKNVVKVRIRVYLKAGEQQGEFLKPKMSVTATVYNDPFRLDLRRDYLWGDEFPVGFLGRMLGRLWSEPASQ